MRLGTLGAALLLAACGETGAPPRRAAPPATPPSGPGRSAPSAPAPRAVDHDELLGGRAPPLEGTTIEGRAFSLADVAGRVVVVSMCATWSDVCADLWLPRAAALEARLRDLPVSFVFVFFDDDDARVRAVVRRLQLGGAALRFATRARGSVGDAWVVDRVPVVFVVDPQGTVLYAHEGFQTGDDVDVETEVRRVLGGREPP